MDKHGTTDLEQRIAQLEATVSQLQQTLERMQSSQAGLEQSSASEQSPSEPANLPSSPQSPPRPSQVVESSISSVQETLPPPVPQPSRLSIDLKNEEFWLNRLGIGLLLLGVGFLFKYSIDQGWITPAVRVGFGFILGMGLLAVGHRLRLHRSALSQVLLGGSVGTFYITIFATYQLYQLWPYLVAFMGMVAVTLLTFTLSVRENHAVLSVVGTIGGLGTPFILYSGQGSLVALIGYTCLILGGASAIYGRQGWRSLLWTTFVITWIIFGVAYDQIEVKTHLSEQIALQLGVLMGGLVFSGLPVVKVLGQIRGALRRSQPPGSRPASNRRQYLLGYGSAQILCVLTPLLVMSFSGSIWKIDPKFMGWIAILLAALYTYLGYGLRRKRVLCSLGNSHLLSACLLLTFALPTQLSGSSLFVVLALEAMVVHWFAQRLSARSLLIAAYLLTVTLSIWLLQRLGSLTALSPALINPQGLADLAVITTLGIKSLQFPSRTVTRIYQILIHITVLMWFWRELSVLSNGSGYVTIAWGLYAIALLTIGLRQDWQQLRWLAMATLFLVVLKLFLYDLANLQALWRILLFLGFGGTFLGLSYGLQVLWNPKPPSKPYK